MMYEELVGALRRLSDWSIMDFEDNLSYANQITEEAADAIHQLSHHADDWEKIADGWRKRYEEVEVAPKEQIYLFVFEDDTTYEMCCGISLKDAVWEMAKYTGNASELFRKSIFSDEFGENDVNDIINLFNHWCYYSCIKSVYVVKEKLFPIKEDKE